MITETDIRNVVGSSIVDVLCDDDGDNAADSQVIQSIVDDTKAIVYANYAEVLSDPTDTDTSMQAITYAKHIAAFLVWNRKVDIAVLRYGGIPKSVTLLYEAAIKGLQYLARQWNTPTDADGAIMGGKAIVTVNTRTQKYTQDYMDQLPDF